MEPAVDSDASESLVTNILTNDDDSNENSLISVNLVNQRHAFSDCGTLKRQGATPPRVDLSRADLIRLLSYLEGELQARDVVIATLKAEKAKQMLYQAKYGRLGLNDPFTALQRDSDTCAASDDFDEASVGRLYESQLAHLERLIAVQRRAHQKAKQVLAGAERRHARGVRELEQEKKRRAHDAAQGDDVCMMLEKERERLKQELENQKSDQAKVEKDFERMRQALLDEKERHKQMVMYLLQERRQLLVRLMEERQRAVKVQRSQHQPEEIVNLDEASTASGSSGGKAETDLLKELETLRKQLNDERKETTNLKEIVKAQEEDLNLIRQMILAKSRQAASQQQQSTTSGSKVSAQAKPASKNEATHGHSSATPVSAAAVSSSAISDPRQPASRPVAVSPSSGQHRPMRQQHSSIELGSPVASVSASLQQQPVRLLTNPAYQQSPHATGTVSAVNKGMAAATSSRSRQVPPPAPHSAGRGHPDASPSAHASSNYAAPRVIPIQLIGPTTNAAAATSSQQQVYSGSIIGGLRRPGLVATSSPPSSQGVVSAAKNYVSNVVAAVTNAATHNQLLASGTSNQRRGQTTVMAPSAGGGSPLKEQWSYATQATSFAPPPPNGSDTSGHRPSQSSINAHRVGIAAAQHQQSVSLHHQQQQQQASGSRKVNASSRTAVSGTASQQQVSDLALIESHLGSNADKREDVVEPELVQLQAVINSMACSTAQMDQHILHPAAAGGIIDRAVGNDSHGMKSQTISRRPAPLPQQQLHSIVPSATPTTASFRNRPPSPMGKIVVHQRPVTANGIVASGGNATGTKRTPTPVPSSRTPLPSSNDSPVPAVTKTSALNCSPTVSMTDCNPPPASDIPQRLPSPSASWSHYGTLGRKVKAMGGLANKIQKRVVAGVVGQSASRQSRPDGDLDGRDRAIRSTQV